MRYILTILCLYSLLVAAQTSTIDSLRVQLLQVHDTLKPQIYSEIGLSLQRAEKDSSVEYAMQGIEMAIRQKNNPALANAFKSLGSIYWFRGEYSRAIKYYFDALQMYKKINDQKGIASILNNIGTVYRKQGNYSEALMYLQEALNITQNMGFEKGISITMGNISEVYSLMHNHEKAIEYARQALEMSLRINDIQSIIYGYYGLAGAYNLQKSYRQAIENYKQCIVVSRQYQNSYYIVSSLNELGKIYIEQSLFNDALETLIQSRQIADSSNMLILQRDVYLNLAQLYSLKNDFKQALYCFKKYETIKDSIFNIEKSKQLTEMLTKYQTDKKEQENLLLRKENELQAADVKRQQFITIVVVLVLLVVGVVAALFFRLYKHTRFLNRKLIEQQEAMRQQTEEIRQINEQLTEQNHIVADKNEKIEQQRDLLEQKNKDITSSINYASRIQQAMLDVSADDNQLPPHFILYRPRDIVSGDFYWIKKLENNHLAWVVADCTGHGVPGAFMSMLGMAWLNEIMVRFPVADFDKPHLVLNALRDKVTTSLKQSGRRNETKDGMDMSFCIIDQSNKIIHFAAAYNPAYIIENGNLNELKPDRMPIGYHFSDPISFTSKSISYKANAVLYMLSDGYTDQPGGASGRKFMAKRLKDILLSIHDEPLKEQHDILSQTFDHWRQKESEILEYADQVDDIIIMALKL